MINTRFTNSERPEVATLPASQTLTGVDKTPETKPMNTVQQVKEKSSRLQPVNASDDENKQLAFSDKTFRYIAKRDDKAGALIKHIETSLPSGELERWKTQEKHCQSYNQYLMQPGKIVALSQDENKPDRVLANFSAIITEQIVEYDELGNAALYYCIEAISEEKTLKTFRVASNEFKHCEWIDARLGVHFVAYASEKELSIAIKNLSRQARERSVYSFLGWHTVNGKRMYLHAGGGIGGGAEIKLYSKELNMLRLPTPLQGEALVHGIHDELALWHLGNDALPGVTVPVFAMPWRALLGNSRTQVYLQAEKHVGKSTIGAIVQNHHGVGFDEKKPGLLNMKPSMSTVFGALRVLATAGDCVVILDDVVWTGSKRENEDTAKKLDAIVRASFSGAGKSKGSSDSKGKQDSEPRAMVLYTGEVAPKQNSTLDRIIALKLERIKYDVEAIFRKCREGVYAGVVAAYITWLIDHWDNVQANVEPYTNELRKHLINDGCSERTALELASLGCGSLTFLDFAVNVGAITEEQAANEWEYVLRGLSTAGKQQQEVQAQEDVVVRFLRVLGEMFRGGKVTLTTTRGGEPEQSHLWGWITSTTTNESTTNSSNGTQTRPGGTIVGYVDQSKSMVYLNVETTVAEVVRYCQQSEPLPITTSELPQQLYARKIIAETDVERDGSGSVKSYCKRVRVGSGKDSRQIGKHVWINISHFVDSTPEH